MEQAQIWAHVEESRKVGKRHVVIFFFAQPPFLLRVLYGTKSLAQQETLTLLLPSNKRSLVSLRDPSKPKDLLELHLLNLKPLHIVSSSQSHQSFINRPQ
ncbi:hypothetical protein VNO77_32900 [Canavalia gladiata]|uniref:Uncharacterized protein n=1 Tax=Canavalia gladiata TaxID=3824 RepID=A0AAN9KEM5_CANGL